MGGQSSTAVAINPRSWIVGSAAVPHDRDANGRQDEHAFVISPEDTDGDDRPDRWHRDADADGTNDLMIDLGLLGGTDSHALAINDVGCILAAATTGDQRRFFLLAHGATHPDDVAPTELQTEESTPPGWTLIDAFALNDFCQLVVVETRGPNRRAFLLSLHK